MIQSNSNTIDIRLPFRHIFFDQPVISVEHGHKKTRKNRPREPRKPSHLPSGALGQVNPREGPGCPDGCFDQHPRVVLRVRAVEQRRPRATDGQHFRFTFHTWKQNSMYIHERTIHGDHAHEKGSRHWRSQSLNFSRFGCGGYGKKSLFWGWVKIYSRISRFGGITPSPSPSPAYASGSGICTTCDRQDRELTTEEGHDLGEGDGVVLVVHVDEAGLHVEHLLVHVLRRLRGEQHHLQPQSTSPSNDHQQK